jgi:hypothetical protein
VYICVCVFIYIWLAIIFVFSEMSLLRFLEYYTQTKVNMYRMYSQQLNRSSGSVISKLRGRNTNKVISKNRKFVRIENLCIKVVSSIYEV